MMLNIAEPNTPISIRPAWPLQAPEGAQTLVPEALLDACRELRAHILSSRRLDCRITVSGTTPPVRGDLFLLQQALLNYATNAVKFTEQGEITLRCRVIEESETDCLLQFEVEDSGIGVSPEDVERLFQSFEQADNSPTRKHGGTGLGLAISKELIERMGGTIGFVSGPQRGSTFWIELPLHHQEDEL